MGPNDSDSSDEESGSSTTTNVMLGYASKEPTDDAFSHLGGYPTWLDDTSAPSAELAKCKICNNMMTLLLQLNGDSPEKFPGHERKLYIFSCRRKACKKKEGTIRAIRCVRIPRSFIGKSRAKPNSAPVQDERRQALPLQDLGNSLFNSTVSSNPNQNPFSSTASPYSPIANPFASRPANNIASPFSPPVAPPPQALSNDLPKTFAEKARISSSPAEPAIKEPWPPQTFLPKPYPSYYLDAEYETLDPTPPTLSKLGIDTDRSGKKADEQDAFESTIDKTFQKFADRLAQNPEQVLRYEFGGAPLLYSKTDPVGKLFVLQQSASTNSQVATVAREFGPSRIPRCQNCSSARVFELQLVPHAIAELEVEEEGLEGMEWGNIILGVCEKDCGERRVDAGEVGWVEEWVGIQWEEDAKPGKS